MDNDSILLSRYASGDHDAFEQLVRRHVNFVYAAARRMLGGPGHEADDVTQAVFLLLAQKASSIRQNVPLEGWLFKATRYCCLNVRKAQGRRRKHEREAAMGQTLATTPEPESLLPVLDEALARLGEKERAAVLARYLAGNTANQTATALGISPEAVEKRLQRGIEKLRRFFAGRGFLVPAAAVVSVLTAESASAAPVGLIAKITPAAGLLAKTTTVAGIAKGAATMMTWAKITSMTTAAAALALAAGVTIVATSLTSPAATPAATSSTPPNSIAASSSAFDSSTPASFWEQVKLLIRRQDAQALRALMIAKTDEEKQFADIIADSLTSMEALRVAAEKQFGKTATDQSLVGFVANLDSADQDSKWVIEGNAAHRVSTRDNVHFVYGPGSLLTRIDNIWRLDFSIPKDMDPEQRAQLPVFLRMERAKSQAENEIIREIAEGKFKDAAAVRDAIQNRVKAAMEQSVK